MDPSSAPATGERVEQLASIGNMVVEQIVSGELEAAVDFLQDQDEFVVVLAGAALLEVDGERLDLGAGDWLLLPRGTPHRLVTTEPGTNWLAVHLHRCSGDPGEPTSWATGREENEEA